MLRQQEATSITVTNYFVVLVSDQMVKLKHTTLHAGLTISIYKKSALLTHIVRITDLLTRGTLMSLHSLTPPKKISQPH